MIIADPRQIIIIPIYLLQKNYRVSHFFGHEHLIR